MHPGKPKIAKTIWQLLFGNSKLTVAYSFRMSLRIISKIGNLSKITATLTISTATKIRTRRTCLQTKKMTGSHLHLIKWLTRADEKRLKNTKITGFRKFSKSKIKWLIALSIWRGVILRLQKIGTIRLKTPFWRAIHRILTIPTPKKLISRLNKIQKRSFKTEKKTVVSQFELKKTKLHKHWSGI